MGILSNPEKIYDGATSLVDLIRKQFGDDIDGAAKELERVGGFPESVARRIATGELPMDPKSVEARRIAQNYGDELYHGSTHDIRAFDGEGNPSNDWGAGTYLTDSTHDVSKNYAGEGPDLTNTLERHVELNEFQDFVGKDDVRTIGGKDFTESQWEDIGPDKQREYLLIDARNEIKGGNEGVIYPVRVKQDGLLSVHDEVELPDYERLAAEDLGYDPDKIGHYSEEIEYEIEERAWDMQGEDYDNPNSAMFGVGNDTGSDMSNVRSIEEGDTWETVKQGIADGAHGGNDDAGRYYSPGSITAETMSRGGAKGVVDPTAPQRFPAMEAGEHTVIFPGNESQIRSVNAAYDPMYTGSNIMGNATVPLLGATAAGTAGLLAVPALMKGEPTSPEERGFESWEEVSRDPTAPLPVPTWGDIGESVTNVLGMPMTGLQGLARGAYGLLTGEDFTEAAAQGGNTMGVGWKDGLLDMSGMNPDKGADQAEAYVTEKTGDESLGWMARMGLLFGGL